MIKKSVRLGDALIDKGIITEPQLMHALKLQKESNFSKKLGEILIQEGFTTHKEMALVLEELLNIEFMDLYAQELDFKLIDRYPLQNLQKAQAIPIREDEEYIFVATSDPLNYDALEALESVIISKPIKLFLAFDDEIRHIFQRLQIIQGTKTIAKEVVRETSQDSYKSDNEESAVLRLITLILKDAVLRKGSDVHIEPNAHEVSVR